MKNGKITHSQLMALLWGGLLAPAAELLPRMHLPQMGRAAWLAPLAALPVVLGGGWALGRLVRGRGLARVIREEMGPLSGGAVLLIYIVWGELLLALRLRLCGERLLAAGDRDGGLWFFLLLLGVAALKLGVSPLNAFARAGQLYFGALLTVGGLVLVLALPAARPERLLPLWGAGEGALLRMALETTGVLGWGVWCAFLAGGVEAEEGEKGGRTLLWLLSGCLVLTAAQGVILGNLGAGGAARLEEPFFALAKSIGVKGAFQRIESMVAAAWLLADLLQMGVILAAQRKLLGSLRPGGGGRGQTAALIAAAVVLALGVLPRQGSAEWWNGAVVPGVNLLLGLVPLVFLPSVLRKNRGRPERKGTSCG